MTQAEPCGATQRPEPEPTDPPCHEKRLATRFVAGDESAAEEVVARYGPRITRLVRRLLGWRPDVDDIVQDTFVSALIARRKFRGTCRLDTWLAKIAVNRCRAFHRKRLVRANLFAAWWNRSAGDEDDPNWRKSLPDEAAVASERHTAVRQAVAKLARKYREVVVLFYLEEKTAQETAEILGLKRNTVEVRLSRARKMLEKMLDDVQI